MFSHQDKIVSEKFTRYCMLGNNMLEIYMGEAIVSRLIIKYLSSAYLSQICRRIGLDKYLRAVPYEVKSLENNLEDMFEAWTCACEINYGSFKLQAFLNVYFDEMNCSIDYNNLYDARTRLNNFAPKFGTKICKANTTMIAEDCFASVIKCQRTGLEGYGEGTNLKNSEGVASECLLKLYRNRMGDKFDKIYETCPSYQNWLRTMKDFIVLI